MFLYNDPKRLILASYVHTYIVQLYGRGKYILASRLAYTSKKLTRTTSLYGHLELIFVLNVDL